MKWSTVLGAVACAGAVSAAPNTKYRQERAAARLERRAQRNGFMQPDEDVATLDTGNGTYHVSYSTNWAGAVLVGTGYNAVTATFVVPTPKAPTGGSAAKSYAASAWVGIDGDTCTTSILQTGVDFTVEAGRSSFQAWYEWYPAYAYNFELAIEAGHTIEMTVTATSKRTGSAVIKNTSTGKSVTHTFTSQTKSLCETNAEWIVEDFEEGSSLVPFADFGSVTFQDAVYNTNKAPTGATIIDLRQSGKVLTETTVSGDTIKVTYV
ncbi:hypothetical protein BX600DRAFT_47934 [Xylariales sp. PMI_506]|nr:hypothetical protein BX600DRAFT_47934 [Xylariales sp. PMI_506]